jgi:hypothetical protein
MPRAGARGGLRNLAPEVETELDGAPEHPLHPLAVGRVTSDAAPARRIAPNPSRFTSRLPPRANVVYATAPLLSWSRSPVLSRTVPPRQVAPPEVAFEGENDRLFARSLGH